MKNYRSIDSINPHLRNGDTLDSSISITSEHENPVEASESEKQRLVGCIFSSVVVFFVLAVITGCGRDEMVLQSLENETLRKSAAQRYKGHARYRGGHLSSLTDSSRLLQDEVFVDVAAPCNKAFFSPTFHAPLNLFHATGVTHVTQTGDKTYQYKYQGMDATVFLDYDDSNYKVSLVLLDGLEAFETFAMHLEFLPLKAGTMSMRRAPCDDNPHPTDGCRLVRRYRGILPRQAAFTIPEFLAANDPDMCIFQGVIESEIGSVDNSG